jgi:hypothetical protein
VAAEFCEETLKVSYENLFMEDEGKEVLAIPGIVDLAHGEDEAGPHAIVFVESEDNVEEIEREISRLSLLASCRVVVQPQLCIGPG